MPCIQLEGGWACAEARLVVTGALGTPWHGIALGRGLASSRGPEVVAGYVREMLRAKVTSAMGDGCEEEEKHG